MYVEKSFARTGMLEANLSISRVCVNIYIYNKHIQHTHIYIYIYVVKTS